ncbi:MAG TPA: hypothetical protein VFA08_03880 [Actinomycetota bacterium]|nr:hypothetical protein [Actinomycetota bacterium]
MPVRTPFLRRRGLWISVATVAACALVVALGVGLIQQREDARERERTDRMATAVNQYRGQIDPVLATVGQPQPPAGFDAFPDLGTTLPVISANGADETALDQAGTVAKDAASAAKSAASLIGDVPVADFIRDRGFSREFVVYMLDSQSELARAMKLYEQAARLVTMAIAFDDPPERQDLLGSADDLFAVAEDTFARAYADYVEAQAAADVFEPVGPTG